jgi:signal peptidase I
MDRMSDSAVEPKSSPLRRVLAIALSLFATGLGQVVMGYPRRGVTWFASSMLVYGAFVGSIATGALSLTWPLFGLIVGLRLAATVNTARITISSAEPRRLSLALMVIGIYVAGSVAGVIGTQFARAYRMPTPSMYPSLEVGDLFLSSHVLDKPQRGQVIVFRYPPDPERSHVQRVIGLPGDTVEIRRGDLVLNGSLIDKRPLSDPCGTLQMECTIWQETIDGNSYKIAIVEEESLADPASRDFGPVTVPAGQLFVLGDNRDNSADSRYWGYLPIELVQANPRLIYWSSGDSGVRWNRITKVVR